MRVDSFKKMGRDKTTDTRFSIVYANSVYCFIKKKLYMAKCNRNTAVVSHDENV